LGSVIDKALASLRRRVRLLILRAVVQLVDDSAGLQRVQVETLAGRDHDSLTHLQPYGLSAVPEPGAEGLVLNIGGATGHHVLIAVDDRRHRPTGGLPGEVRYYSRFGQLIELKADGSIALTPAAGQPIVVNGDITVNGNVVATGEVSDALGSLTEMRGVYNAHVHPENDNAGGNPNTGAPLTPMA